jgi:hypothetical protein
MTEQTTPSIQSVDVKGHELIATVKELIHEGNVHRIHIKDADGNSLLEMPVSVGVIGLLVAPTVTAIGTLGALCSDYSIDIEREHPGTEADGVTAVAPGVEVDRAQDAGEHQ